MVGYAHVCVETNNAKKCTCDWGEFVFMYFVKVALYCVHTKISLCVRVWLCTRV